MTDGWVGQRFKDTCGITHLVEHGAKNLRIIGSVYIWTACDLQCNVDLKVSLRKRGDVDCMGCLVGFR